MPLSPPADRTGVYLAGVVGVGVALALFVLTRSSLPHVGDNIHHLPHGGRYRDGTKSVDYCGPATRYPSSNLLSNRGGFGLLLFVVFLIFLIWLSDNFGNRNRCARCNTIH
ncbi:triple gene block protein 2 [Helleborus mosaic virus]|uniref:Movement protein TGB2 n=1 Tax=Helleborus mosaic virus TaxID=592207 RepID=B9UZ43_9VIRU|nr:triple gene block protein 2 [Helleborus mosaic virus]ACM45999.1 triple gene block protein 2 [Helleborus mosaic virus]WPR15566.1 triple gene block protein 2 [Helleborus mosaic virus]